MSIEKQVRKARRRLFFWRLLGDVVAAPRMLFEIMANVFLNLAKIASNFEKTVFAMEVDASRVYRALTGVDLGIAVGEPNRYSGARQGVAQLRDDAFDGRRRDADDEDE